MQQDSVHSKSIKLRKLNNPEQPELAPQRLSNALFLYMLAVVLIITLAPFQFYQPQKLQWYWFTDPTETLQNVFLFVPLGFLAMAVLKKADSRKVVLVSGLGFLLSFCIEIIQLYSVGRYSSLIDVLNNGVGAVLGAYAFRFFYPHVRRQGPGVLWLEIPLSQLLIILVPLMWLCGMAMGKELNRLWLLLLPGFCGAIILTEVYKNRLLGKTHYSRMNMFMIFTAWFFVASIPALSVFPLRVLVVLYFPIAVFVYFRLSRLKSSAPTSGRFEIETLAKIWPLVFFFIFLIGQWPISALQWPIQFYWLDPSFFSDDRLVTIMRIIEYIAAFSVAGYMISQQTARLELTLKAKKVYTFLIVLSLVMVMETTRGLHPAHGVSLWGFTSGLLSAVFGIYIHVSSLRLFKKLRSWQDSEN